MRTTYEITEEDANKKGFLKFKDISIFLNGYEDIKEEVRLANIEFFGRAIKVFVKNKEVTDIEYIINHFSHEKIECVELFNLENEKKMVGFSGIKIIIDDNSVTVLSEYFDFVEKNIKYFFNEYKKTRILNYQDINLLSGLEFEQICQRLVSKMGFEVEPTKATGDGGIDLIAYNNQPLLEGKYIIQCKRYTGSVGEPILRDLYGVVTSERANKGILITTGYFTQKAICFAEGKPIELIDGDEFNNLIMQYEVNTATNDFINYRDIKNVFQENILLDYKYEEYELMIHELNRNSSNDKLRAKTINYLFKCISDADEKVEDKFILFNECKNHIIKYLKNQNSNTRFLRCLYMMLYMQISILEGKFDEAMDMFFNITKLKEFNISGSEISKTKDTMEIRNNGIYNYFYETVFNAIQVCNILNDTARRKSIITRYKSMFDYKKQRLEKSINTPIEIRKQYLPEGSFSDINKVFARQNQHWATEIEDIRNIDRIIKLYILHDYALASAYDVVYEVGQDYNNGSEICYISVNKETDMLIIDGFNYETLELPSISKKILHCKTKLL